MAEHLSVCKDSRQSSALPDGILDEGLKAFKALAQCPV